MIRRGSSDPHRICIDLTDADYHALLAIADSSLVSADFTLDDFCREAIQVHIQTCAAAPAVAQRAGKHHGPLGPRLVARPGTERSAW